MNLSQPVPRVETVKVRGVLTRRSIPIPKRLHLMFGKIPIRATTYTQFVETMCRRWLQAMTAKERRHFFAKRQRKSQQTKGPSRGK